MPYPSEHAARIISPEKFEKESFRRINIAPGIDIIVGHLIGEKTMTTQAYRFDKSKFTAQEAKDWLKKHDIKYILFEPAKKSENSNIVVNQTDNSVEIYLYGIIGSWENGNEVDGDYISQQIRYYDDAGIKIIHEHINSDGGEITNGLSIVTANLNCKNAQVYTYNDGVAASMGGVVHQSGSKRFAVPYSQFMIHEPKINGETIETTIDPIIKKRLEAAKEQLIQLFIKSTGLPQKQLETMMQAETWLNAQECEDLGFVSPGCILSYPTHPNIQKETSAKDILILVNQAFNNLNSNNMKNIKCEKCDKEFDYDKHKVAGEDHAICPGCKAKVDDKGKEVDDDSDEDKKSKKAKADKEKKEKEDREKAEKEKADKEKEDKSKAENFADLSAKVVALTNLVNGYGAENATLKAKLDASTKKDTENLLNAAIEQEKIVATAKDQFLTDYALNPDGLKRILDAIPTPHNSILGVINHKDDGTAGLPNGYKSLREFEKKDPKGAERFALENPVAYDKLYKMEYK